MAIFRRITNLFRRSKVDREIEAELRAHIAMRTADNIAAGMTREDARRDALVRFGNPTSTREHVAGADAALLLDSISFDVRYALRQLWKNPGFAVTAVAVLALGIGASTAIFSFVDAALINPLPYPDPNRLVAVYETVDSCPLCNVSYQNYLDWKRANLPFSTIEAWGYTGYTLSTPGGTLAVQGTRVRSWDGGVSLVVPGRATDGKRNDVPERDVSAGYLRTLGAHLIRGRYFTEAEDDDTKPRVIVINRTLAEHFFPGENPIGKRLAYEHAKDTMEIIGEVEDVKEGALDSQNQPAIYVPFMQDSYHAFYIVVRTAQPEQTLLPTLMAAIHEIDPRIATADELTMTDAIGNSPSAYLHRSSAWLAGCFAGLALVLSIVGLYGVLAYSVSQRTREIGVRIALGAQRGMVYRLILREAGRLAVTGIAAGLLCSIGAATLMRSLLFGVQAWDVSTLAVVAAVLALSAFLAAYVPARRAASIDPMQALRSE